MSRTLAVSLVVPSTPRPGHWDAARLALAALGVVGLLTATTRSVDAQPAPEQSTADAQATPEQKPRWEFIFPRGP